MQLARRTDRGSDLNTKEYRKLSNISYSDIKQFLTDRKMFYRKKILGEEVAEKQTLAKTIGDLVHCKLLEPQNWDKLFTVATVQVSGQMGTLAENLYARTLKYLDPDTKESIIGFNELMEMAIQDTRYNNKGEEVAFKKKTFEWIVEQFSGSSAETYYQEMRNNYGKTVIMPYNDEQADHIVKEALENTWVNRWLIDQPGEESHNELPVTYEHAGVEVKNLIDRMIINHDEKWVQPADVKSLWDNENFQKNYLHLYYYIQGGLYDKGAIAWAKQQKLEGYDIKPMKFVCVDSQGHMKSLLYSMTRQDIEMADKGFSINGRKYPGIYEAIADIKWGIDTGIWNCSREAYENNGICNMNLQYE